MSSERIIYYKDEDGCLEYELYGETLVLHSNIYNWKLSVLKKCLRILNTMFTEAKAKGIEYIMTVTPNPKFAQLFGGRTTYKFEYEEKEYEVVRWDLK